MYVLHLDHRIKKDLQHIHPHIRKQIIRMIKLLAVDPTPTQSKKLVGYKNVYRLRKSNYRAVYSIDYKNKAIFIHSVAHRSAIYKHML